MKISKDMFKLAKLLVHAHVSYPLYVNNGFNIIIRFDGVPNKNTSIELVEAIDAIRFQAKLEQETKALRKKEKSL